MLFLKTYFCKKGLVTKDLASKKQIFLAREPEVLRNILEPQKKELTEQEKQINIWIREAELLLKEREIHLPKIVHVQQDQIENFLYERTPIWNKSMEETGTDYLGFLDFTFTEIYHEWIDWYWNHSSSKNIHLRFLTNETQFEKEVMTQKKYQRRNLKFWEKAGQLTYNTWINGDFTIMINTRTRPFYLLEIRDKNLAQSQRQIFEAIWEEAKTEKKASLIRNPKIARKRIT